MGSNGSRRIGGLALASLLLGGCLEAALVSPPASVPTPSSTPSAEATSAPTQVAVVTPAPSVMPTTQPTAEPSPEPTVGPEPTVLPCPTARLLTVREFVEAPRSCFARRELRVKGWLDEPPATGFLPPLIRPLWLAYPEGGQTCDEPTAECFYSVALWHDMALDDDHLCTPEASYCGFLIPHSAPGTGLHFQPLEEWVILTGHTDDPAALRCHFEDPPPDSGIEPGELDDADAIEGCRQEFVVTEIDRVDSP